MKIDMEALQDFFYFINERHKVFLLKEHGAPKPWTRDPIIQEWKFCNPFRINDKQTRWLKSEVIDKHIEDDPALLVFNIYFFRAFNLNKTYEKFGWIDTWQPEVVEEVLNNIQDEGRPITSGAYMIRGRQGIRKSDSIIMSLTDIWDNKEDVASNLEDFNALEQAFRFLKSKKFWGWGNFTTYQIVLDLMLTPLLCNPEDIDEWCIFGPGAARGIRQIYPYAMTSEFLAITKVIHSMQRKHLESHVPYMTLQDIEFSLCELSKYRRIKLGGKGKERYNGRS